MKLTLEEKTLIRRVILGGFLVLAIVFIGTEGYMILTDANWFDSLYMTVITVTTIGFGEVIETHHNPPARLWTMFIAFGGVSIITYIITGITASLVDGKLVKLVKIRRMEYNIKNFEGHYIICGIGRVGSQIARELTLTHHTFVCGDTNREKIYALETQLHRKIPYVIGDCTEDDILHKLNINKAHGIFVATDDDNANLVICVAARNLNPKIRIVVMAKEPRFIPKLYSIGAEKVVSPSLIGGIRMANEMLRPDMMGLLDGLTHNEILELRMEEVKIPPNKAPFAFGQLPLDTLENTVLIAIRKSNKRYVVKPKADFMIEDRDTLVILTSPAERQILDNFLNSLPDDLHPKERLEGL